MALHLFHLGQSRPNGLDVCLRCLGLCWQRVLALGSETLIPSSAHVSCPSTHTRWFVGMFDSVRLVTGSLDGGRGCGTLARAIYIHSFTGWILVKNVRMNQYQRFTDHTT